MRQGALRSPLIRHLAFGRIDVEGFSPFKDAKLFPGGARQWDWRETGTQHIPGIQPADIEDLIAHGSEAVVLSLGMWKRLRVCPQTLTLLARNGIAAEILETRAAVRRYNELRETLPVGGLFHSTC
jgi:hypothetical protein